MIDTLATFADQVTTVAREVGVEGKLGGQASVPGAAGTWRDLTDNVNQLAANLTTQVRAIADVATAVTKGDLTRSISLDKGMDAQQAYISRTLDMIEKSTGVRSRGWSSPSVFPNVDTYAATAAEGIKYSLDGMDSDVLTRLMTSAGPLVMIPYPAQTVDMGQYLSRFKEASDLERLWIDYVGELAREAAANPDREATVVAIGIHPFVVGTPAGASAMRRVLENFRKLNLVWVSDVEAVLKAAGETF
jgi:HAMP domain-containing protein